MFKSYFAAPTAEIVDTIPHFGAGVHLGRKAKIGAGVLIGAGSKIGSSSTIEFDSVIGENVVIGRSVRIGPRALIMSGAIICPNDVKSVSSDGRKLDMRVSIGPGVRLHDEVELDARAIIPAQDTIAHIGSFGRKNRIVTIYGSDDGPRYSIGCQVGVPMTIIEAHVEDNSYTTAESASSYAPYLGIYREIGSVVQMAYERHERLVDEIRHTRIEHGI